MTEIAEWISSLPIFTRYWLISSVSLTLIARFGFLNPNHLYLFYEPFFNGLQIWRPVTALFYYPLSPSTGIHYLTNCYIIYKYSMKLEKDVFGGRPADYLFMLLFNWICCTILGLCGQIILLMDPMVMSVLYVWCQLNPDVLIFYWFGSQFKAKYFPWVLVVVNTVLSGGGISMQELLGIIVGHTYFFMMFKYPQIMGGQSLIKIPQILHDWFPNRITNNYGAQRQINRGRHMWGRGHVLGDSS